MPTQALTCKPIVSNTQLFDFNLFGVNQNKKEFKFTLPSPFKSQTERN